MSWCSSAKVGVSDEVCCKKKCVQYQDKCTGASAALVTLQAGASRCVFAGGSSDFNTHSPVACLIRGVIHVVTLAV